MTSTSHDINHNNVLSMQTIKIIALTLCIGQLTFAVEPATVVLSDGDRAGDIMQAAEAQLSALRDPAEVRR